MAEKQPLVQVENLSKHFIVGKSVLRAVDNVSLTICRGETLGLVGESGCGKTTFGRTLLQLYRPTSGTIIFDGKNVSGMKRRELVSFKKDAQIIFQDPYASLDPRMTIGDIVAEGLNVHFSLSGEEQRQKAAALLQKVGLGEDYISRYAHELSGGQRQRVGIARALAVEPRFIVCDEPISALDVSIQAQVINLLIQLQRDFSLTYLFISHDLSMVRYISDRIGVMYLGSLMELADNETLYSDPVHPYTQALLSAIPVADPDLGTVRQRIKLEGEIPSPINMPSGCKFHQRCRCAQEICSRELPELREVAPGHMAACHFAGELSRT